jgi:Tfp pilus assembly protein PilO
VNRRTVILGALAAIGVVALWWVFLYSPKGKDLNDARRQLSEATRQTQTLTAQLKQLQDLQQNNPKTEAELARFAAAIPAQPNQADFISGLNDIANQSGITWQSVTMQEPTAVTPGAPASIAVQITLQGGFFQTLDYLNRLEKLQRLVVVDSVTINSSKSGTSTTGPSSGLTTTGSGDLSVSLNARIFSQSTLDNAPSGSTPSGSTNGGGSGAPNNGVTN